MNITEKCPDSVVANEPQIMLCYLFMFIRKMRKEMKITSGKDRLKRNNKIVNYSSACYARKKINDV